MRDLNFSHVFFPNSFTAELLFPELFLLISFTKCFPANCFPKKLRLNAEFFLRRNFSHEILSRISFPELFENCFPANFVRIP